MATSHNGPASARESDVMSGLEVRSPAPAARSTVDVADEVLAQVRDAPGEPGARPLAPDALAAKVSPNAFSEIEARKPPGPRGGVAGAEPIP